MSEGGLSTRDWQPPAEIAGLERRAWAAGAIGAAASLAGLVLDADRFFQSYLTSWLLWLGVALGCLGILALHHLSRGAWGLMIRRPLEAAARTVPFLGLLFVPVLLRLDAVYAWARPEAAADPLLAGKAPYLNPTFFSLRALGYFAIWTAFAWILSGWSARQDRTGEPGLFRRMQSVAAPALGIYALTATFASVDWLMSLDPHWFSSLFGVYFIGGHAVSALAFIVPVALWLGRREPMSRALTRVDFHDYGKLLLAFVMLWAYFAVSQLLIIWSGNLPEETVWYVERTQGGWQYVALALALFHFVLPFLLLLSRDLKRDARRLAIVALVLLVMRWFDLFWQAAPAFHPHGISVHWLDLATLVGVGGIWLALFFGQLRRRALLPINDPFMEEALARE